MIRIQKDTSAKTEKSSYYIIHRYIYIQLCGALFLLLLFREFKAVSLNGRSPVGNRRLGAHR